MGAPLNKKKKERKRREKIKEKEKESNPIPLKHLPRCHVPSQGKLELTPEHAVYLNGRFAAAADATVGSRLLLQPATPGAAPVETVITAVEATRARIINPVTESMRILAGVEGGMVLAGTTPYGPNNIFMRIGELPSLYKVISLAMPEAVQASVVYEAAFTSHGVLEDSIMAAAAAGLPFPVIVAVVYVVDAIVAAVFLATQFAYVAGSVAAVAVGVSVLKRRPAAVRIARA
eukprot:364943-Chlamydomonas_euryale.AAC.30